MSADCVFQKTSEVKKITGIRRDVHDKQLFQTIGGSAGMKALSPKRGLVNADESESSSPGPNIKQLSNQGS